MPELLKQQWLLPAMLPRDGAAGSQHDTSESAASSWKDFRGIICERGTALARETRDKLPGPQNTSLEPY